MDTLIDPRGNVGKRSRVLVQRRGGGITISVNHEVLNMSFSPSSSTAEAEPASPAPVDSLLASIETDRPDAFVSLGSAFLTRLPAAPLPDPYLVGISADTAAQLGFNTADAQDPAFAELFAGNPTREWPTEKLPYASVYSGHQ